MHIFRVPALIALVLSATVAAAPPQAARAQAATATASGVTSRVSVAVPQQDTELLVDDQPVPGTGPSRRVETAPLPSGTTRQYTFTARWRPNGYTEMTRSKTVTLRAGEAATVDLSAETSGDRVRVIYVPTPTDVAEEMVRLARVTSNDVVYEPGCGDARITIAAMRAGARRAICIDIDEDRAEESRANVRAAGMADRIDVRLGDALDLKDLSEVTVVLLYMGDHFNMLIRPVLWRDLKVGSRIVSHRFTMGDWTPDRTVMVESEQGGEYELHLWTVTEDVKRRLNRR
jgi:uncharacterized protein (TIGR03000 family)